MRISQEQARAWFEQARVARLATVDRRAHPHLVPVTFACHDGVIVTAVDHKPKSTTSLKRLRNIAENPNVTLLADHYDDDWSRLWWVRADGVAEVVDAADRSDLVHALTAKYSQYREQPPALWLIVVQARGWNGWAA